MYGAAARILGCSIIHSSSTHPWGMRTHTGPLTAHLTPFHGEEMRLTPTYASIKLHSDGGLLQPVMAGHRLPTQRPVDRTKWQICRSASTSLASNPHLTQLNRRNIGRASSVNYATAKDIYQDGEHPSGVLPAFRLVQAIGTHCMIWADDQAMARPAHR